MRIQTPWRRRGQIMYSSVARGYIQHYHIQRRRTRLIVALKDDCVYH